MPDFKPGQIVQLGDGRKATVRFAGQTSFQVGEWIGVELEDKTGKNDGSVQGVRYFDCPAGYGMFVKPMMATIIAQAPSTKPVVRKPARPSSFHPASVKAAPSGDVALAKRRSLNAPSPSPVPKSRPTSLVRVRPGVTPQPWSSLTAMMQSPIKSPTKQLGTASSASASRTVTPSNARVPSASAVGAARARTSVGGQRTSMGPPAAPALRTTRLSSISSATARASGAHTRSASGARGPQSMRVVPRPDSGRRPSADSQAGRDSGSADDASLGSPMKSDGEILSPQPTSPVTGRAKALERIAAATSPGTCSTPASSNRTTAPVTAQRSSPNPALSRENEDLKAKLKVLERKRLEDRDKLSQLDRVQSERDKFEGIIQKLQQKYQPQQQEYAELRKQMKEAEARFISIEKEQADLEAELELSVVNRQIAELDLEDSQSQVEALKLKTEELELKIELLEAENSDYCKGMSPEERASAGWMQMESANERLREALIRLRDITQDQEKELRDQIAGLEEDVKELGPVKLQYDSTKEKLARSEEAVEQLKEQLNDALGAQSMIEELSEQNMDMSAVIEKLRLEITELETLKEIDDELEANHVQLEKQMQEELDMRDAVILEQTSRAARQQSELDDRAHTILRFRELVESLQADLDDMRASQAVTEGESEKLNDGSRAMMDLNMKLQISVAKAQVKTIDLELRHLDAQEAEQHLEIVKLFLPDTYQEDRDSVLALLRFRRLAFKANLVNGLIKERINGKPQPGHEDDVLAGCDAVDKLVWVATACDRFINDISHCTTEQFSAYQKSLLELEPVERALNSWIDSLRRDDLKEKKCAEELQRTISLMSHLAEVHISDGLASFANHVYMSSLVVQSHLDSAVVAFNTTRAMVQRAIPPETEGDEMSQLWAKKFDTVITQTRSAKVIAGKAVRALEDLKTRSLSPLPDTKPVFEQCEHDSRELAHMARVIGNRVHLLLTQDEGRAEPFTHGEIQNAIHQSVLDATSASESETFSAYLAKLRKVTGQISDIAALATDLDQTEEFDVHLAPWELRSQELKTLKTVPADAEEELRRLREEYHEARRTIAQRDEHLSTAVLKIDTLESRMRDAQTNIERIDSLQKQLEASGEQVTILKEDIEKQDRELKGLESERDKWEKIASDSRAYADGADAAGTRAGQERAVATAREMDALKKDIEGLQSAVRFLREDSRRARVTEQHSYDWLAEPLRKPTSRREQRKALVVAEGKDVLGELVRMATTSTVFDFGALPKDKLAWKPAKSTPQYLAAKQMEDFAAWDTWHRSVLRKSSMLRAPDAGTARPRNPAAQLQIRLPGPDGKMKTAPALGRDVQVVGSREWEALQSSRIAV
ncbi:DYNACTIN ro-3 [Metarhizium album ARSEF 1941]|uniref:DYNACTIN ro-3 n=1 Tax=Metarhizium album (strain ARSEF 1941) TaxID=1081103 RepID=A0A0B2X852_METAS|nr:DYNACTIN ro-3 [Metarhizium album ARSEF 1941]KHO01948.1 DYNACTIN ro-3 [Metarhizium album ARSEF 1941]